MNFYKRVKLALRGNIERMNDPLKDPYRIKRGPNEDAGFDLNRLGDESVGSSVGGTNARGGTGINATYPKDYTAHDDYELQRKRNVPSSTFMFVKDHDETMYPDRRDDEMDGGTIGQGVDSTNMQDFTDYRDRLPTERETFGPSPMGPTNMNTFRGKSQRDPWKDIFSRIKKKTRGLYR